MIAIQAFETLKQAMMHKYVLALSDFICDFITEVDVSGHGIGAVLMQQRHQIAYLSIAQTLISICVWEGINVIAFNN